MFFASRLYGLNPAQDALLRFNYLFPTVEYDLSGFQIISLHGEIELFRAEVTKNIHAITSYRCADFRYKVGSKTMDSSGLGNILYGYFTYNLPPAVVRAWANLAQGFNPDSRWQFVDNPGDAAQIRFGRKLAEISGNEISPSVDEIINHVQEYEIDLD
jgi:hypothetical protein